MGWSFFQAHGCWPAVVLAVEPLPHHASEPFRGWRYRLEPCGVPGQWRELDTDRDNVAQQPCAACAAAWTAAGWQQLAGRAGE